MEECSMKGLLSLISVLFIILILSAHNIHGLTALDLIPYGSQSIFGITMNKTKLNQIRNISKINHQIKKLQKLNINIDNIYNIYGGSFDQIQKKSNPNVIIILYGNFNKNSIYQAIKDKDDADVSEDTYLNISYLKSENTQKYSLAIIHNQFLIIAKEHHLKMALNLSTYKGRSVRSDSQLMSGLKMVSWSNVMWIVTKLSPKMKSQFRGQYSSIKYLNTVSLSYHTSSNDIIRIYGYTPNRNALPQIKQAIKKFIAQNLQLFAMVTQNSDLIEIANSASVISSGNYVTVSISIQQKHIHKLLKNIK